MNILAKPSKGGDAKLQGLSVNGGRQLQADSEPC